MRFPSGDRTESLCRPWDGALAVSFPARSALWADQVAAGLLPESAARSLPVFPVQLLEALGCLALGVALAALYLRAFSRDGGSGAAAGGRHPLRGVVLAGYLAGYGALRFWTETLRGDARARPLGGALSISQTISAGAIALSAALFVAVAVRRARAGRHGRA